MLAFIGNMGFFEFIVILVIAVLVFGKDLPQAASKAYLQVRKLRSAVEDLRRDSGIDRELRNIERTVREAEWEARRTDVARPPATPAQPRVERGALPATPAAATPETTTSATESPPAATNTETPASTPSVTTPEPAAAPEPPTDDAAS